MYYSEGRTVTTRTSPHKNKLNSVLIFFLLSFFPGEGGEGGQISVHAIPLVLQCCYCLQLYEIVCGSNDGSDSDTSQSLSIFLLREVYSFGGFLFVLFFWGVGVGSK